MIQKEENSKGIFWYEQVQGMGFVRDDYRDSVVFSKTGQHPFFMQRYLMKVRNIGEITLQWDYETGKIEMVRCDGDSNVLGRVEIRDMEHLQEIINFFCENKQSISAKRTGTIISLKQNKHD